jgi:imidazolonepropionase
MAGLKYGLVPKLHANEFDYSGGVQIGVKYNALSVDHLECTGDTEIESLLGSATMPTLLPGSVFFLGLRKPPTREMIDRGLPVALASDYNPGSSPSGNMSLSRRNLPLSIRTRNDPFVYLVTYSFSCRFS